jgi:hypothetical protein
VLIALIQVVVGGSVFRRSDAQEAALQAKLVNDRAALVAGEVPRMETVMANFRIYKAVELVVFALGVVLTFLFPHRDFLYSMGIGCIAQAALMLVLDLFAEHRGAAYLAMLRSLTG